MKLFSLHAAVVVSAATTTHQIKAGPGLKFYPDTLNAAQGDFIEFHFYARNHSVATGDYNNPCQLANPAGFFSGYIPATRDLQGDQVFRVMVNDTDPIWYYCTQGTHCPGGMVGVINPPMDPKDGSLDVYKARSAQFSGKTADAESVFGGELAPASADNCSTTTTTDGLYGTALPTQTVVFTNGAHEYQPVSGGLLVVMYLLSYGPSLIGLAAS